MKDETTARKSQNCGSCRYAEKCYSKRASPRNVVINILACRIRMGIKPNASSKLLLEMIRPSLIRLVHNARARVGNGYIDVDSLILDLESRVIECLLDENGYRIGESAYLTEYLFGTNPKTGWVRKWILWNFSRSQRFYKKHTLSGGNPKSDAYQTIPEQDRAAIADYEVDTSHESSAISKDTIDSIFEIINDGITLNVNEFRVLAFCLAHANESNRTRLIDGTHTYLSEIMSVSRPRITKLYAVAKKKLIEEVERREISLN